jgi:Asp-tRNA(Asn)/Glu-tRNA(Gln) amidotransferase A subunit family amidase
MAEATWQGDACSLVDAFRSGDRSPLDELDATLAAIEGSDLNAFSFVDADAARERARQADVRLPFGGVPIGVKELEQVEGWPDTEASLAFSDRVASHTGTMASRVFAAGANPVGLTTAREFGGLNIGVTRLNGITHNPWGHDHTPGGSSSGSAAAVAGGLVTIASGGDGGGSIRIPAGFNGLVGMKGTAGRIPRGPRMLPGPMTVVLGCLARSVRDVARWFDVANGSDAHDPYSLPRVTGWETGLGTHNVRGLRVAVSADLGTATVRPEVIAAVERAAADLIADAGLEVVDDVAIALPELGLEWALSNLATLIAELGDRWPGCRDDLTPEITFGLDIATELFNLDVAARCEQNRMQAFESMASVFDQVDLVICATNPDVAFPAEVTVNTRVGEVEVGLENNGALTIPANICGNPAISIPVGTVVGLPVGMQIIGRHHHDAALLDLAGIVEQRRPWPLVAPGV